jgi:hypothetical protein
VRRGNNAGNEPLSLQQIGYVTQQELFRPVGLRVISNAGSEPIHAAEIIEGYPRHTINKPKLDGLRNAYKQAVENWVNAIRKVEALATPDYSVHAWDLWEQAGFDEENARQKALDAKKEFAAGLRDLNYGIQMGDN